MAMTGATYLVRVRWLILGIGILVAVGVSSRLSISAPQVRHVAEDQGKAAAALEKLGAQVFRDDATPGEHVTGVDLDETRSPLRPALTWRFCRGSSNFRLTRPASPTPD
jgi:hypothetical protein